MNSAFHVLVLTSLLLSPPAYSAATYSSVDSAVATPSLTNDLIAGIAPTGTATREGGDNDTATVGLASLTNGVTATFVTGRSFVNPGTLDFDLGGTFDISTIYFRLVNPVRDSRLTNLVDVWLSYDNGSNYTRIAQIEDRLGGTDTDYAKTGTLSNIGGMSVTNLRIEILGNGSYPSSYSEIDVIGTAVPEPSGLALLMSAACLFITRRRRNQA